MVTSILASFHLSLNFTSVASLHLQLLLSHPHLTHSFSSLHTNHTRSFTNTFFFFFFQYAQSYSSHVKSHGTLPSPYSVTLFTHKVISFSTDLAEFIFSTCHTFVSLILDQSHRVLKSVQAYTKTHNRTNTFLCPRRSPSPKKGLSNRLIGAVSRKITPAWWYLVIHILVNKTKQCHLL